MLKHSVSWANSNVYELSTLFDMLTVNQDDFALPGSSHPIRNIEVIKSDNTKEASTEAIRTGRAQFTEIKYKMDKR